MTKLTDIRDKQSFYNLCKTIEAQGNPVLSLNGSIAVFADPLDIAVIESLIEIPDRSNEPEPYWSRKPIPFDASIMAPCNVVHFFQTLQLQTGTQVTDYIIIGDGLEVGETDRYDFLYWLDRVNGKSEEFRYSVYDARFGGADRIADYVTLREEYLLVSAQLKRLQGTFLKRYTEWTNSGKSADLLAVWAPGFSRAVYEAIIKQSWDEQWYM